MNELTKIKDRILERIEIYIGDIEFAEEQELTEDEKTIFKSVKNIILEEFDRASLEAPLPRFIYEDEESKHCDMFRFKEMLVKEDREKFQKFLNEHERLRATHSEAKEIIEESIEMLEKQQTNTAKWVSAGVGVDCMGNRFKEYKCSNCGNIDLSHRKNKFCPECGKRMEG